MQSYSKYLLLALAPLALPLFCVNKADAIPAFSREHNTECTTCHTVYPELNEYGEAFLKNGFVWTKNKLQEKEAPKAIPRKKAAGGGGTAEIKGEGDPELLEKLKASAKGDDGADVMDESPEEKTPSSKKSEPLWLAGLPEKLPLSVTATLNATYDEHPVDKDKLDLSSRALSLLAGGVFRDKISFYAKYNLYAQGAFDPAVSNTPSNTNPDIEEVYIVWRKALDTPINLKVGRFRPTLSLWKKNNKITVSDFATTSYRIGNSLFALESAEDALEANAVLGNRLFVAGGVVDRNGQDTKEGYGHISFKIGGSDFLGKEPEVDLEQESMWDYFSLTVAGYGYVGRNSISLASSERNNFYRAGVDLDAIYKSLRLKLSGVKGRDNNPDFASDIKTDSMVYAAQAEYMFDINLMGLVRYEHQDTGTEIVRRYIPSIAYAPIQNTKVSLEYQYESGQAINRKTLLGLRIAF